MATAASVIVGLGRRGTSQAHSRELFDEYLDKTGVYMALRYKKSGAGGLDGLLERPDAAASSLVFPCYQCRYTPVHAYGAVSGLDSWGPEDWGYHSRAQCAGIRKELVL